MSASEHSNNFPNNKIGQEIFFTEKNEWSETSLLILLQEVAFKWCSGCPKKYSVLLNDFLQTNNLPKINFSDLFLNLNPIKGTDIISNEISNALSNIQTKSTSYPTSPTIKQKQTDGYRTSPRDGRTDVVKKPSNTQVSNVYNKHKWADLQSSRPTSPVPTTGFQLYISGANSSTSSSGNPLTVAAPHSPTRKNGSRRSESPNLQAPSIYPSHSVVKVNMGHSSENSQKNANNKTSKIMNNDSINGHLQNGSLEELNKISLCDSVSNNTSNESTVNGVGNLDSEEGKIKEIEKTLTGKPPIVRRSSGSDFNCIVTKIPDQQKASLVKVSMNDESALNQNDEINKLNIDMVSSTVIERAYAKKVSIDDSDKAGIQIASNAKLASDATDSIMVSSLAHHNKTFTTDMHIESCKTDIDSLVSGKTCQILKDEKQANSCKSSMINKININQENISSDSSQTLNKNSVQIIKSNDDIVSKASPGICETTSSKSDPITCYKEQSSNQNDKLTKHCQHAVTSQMMTELLENSSHAMAVTTKTSTVNKSETSLESLSCERQKLESVTVAKVQKEEKKSKSSCRKFSFIDSDPNISTYIEQVIY